MTEPEAQWPNSVVGTEAVSATVNCSILFDQSAWSRNDSAEQFPK